ncbi:MAG: phage tail tube protein [Pseudomonas sp.]|uniref:phage tail tube protein n=1 Tax=Pseudomonas sp. TaxID=306 RepID=UPI003D700277
MSSGAKNRTAYVEEVTQGVTPATGWKELIRTSYGLGPTQNTAENNEISQTRMNQGTSATTIDVAGEIGQKWRYGGAIDDFLESCFGSRWSSDTLTVGDERISYSVASFASDVLVSSIARGAQVASMAFTFGTDDDITVATNMTAIGWAGKVDATPYFSSAAPEANARRFNFKDFTSLTLDGVEATPESGTCISAMDLTFDNNVQTQRCINNGAFIGNVIPTTFSATGSITVAWSAASYNLWIKQQTGDAIAVSFTIENGDGRYTITLPEMEVNGDWPDGAATDVIEVQLNVAARRTPPTITRAPFVAVTSLSIAPATVNIAAAATAQLTATALPSGSSQAVTWTSSDPAKATVSSTGLVTGVAAGSAVITATSVSDPSKTATRNVTITA